MPKTLQKLFDFYLKSSMHVALAVAAFAGVTMQTFEIDKNPGFLLFIFFGTVTGYNFVKYSAIAKLKHSSLTKNLRIIQIFSLLCFIGLIYFATKQSTATLIVAAISGLITALYALPVFRNEKNLRGFYGTKVFVIAIVWSAVTVLLPTLQHDVIYLYDTIIEFLQRCLFVIVLTLPFDIRDLRDDVPQLGTIPQLFGVQKTRSIGTLLLAGVIFLEILKPLIGTGEVVVLLVITAITWFLIRKSVTRQSRYFAAFWVEGVPVLWWVLLLLVETVSH